jgi:hypothetical protein
MKFVPKTVTRTFARQILKTKKSSPHIFFAVGVAGAVTSTVLACRATLKLPTILDDNREVIAGVKRDLKDTPEYGKDLAYVYGRSTGHVLKLYAPAAVVGGLSIAALTGSHVQLVRRNSAITAAFTAVAASLEGYRGRVREEIGAQREGELYRNQDNILVNAKDEDGKKKILVPVVRTKGFGPYARIFDDINSTRWRNSSELNTQFLLQVQSTMQHTLVARGHVFLNEVHDALGLERTPEGQIVGWVWNSKNGDNFIDFGIFEAHAAEFMAGREPSVWLDFNVDGPVWDLI